MTSFITDQYFKEGMKGWIAQPCLILLIGSLFKAKLQVWVTVITSVVINETQILLKL